jgi:hypothetical protein
MQAFVKIEPGETLLLDIPRGMQDTIENLLHAAAIRCYVPEFFPSHTPHTAYQIYLQLPKGLSKMRYEAEAWKWSQVSPVIAHALNTYYPKSYYMVNVGVHQQAQTSRSSAYKRLIAVFKVQLFPENCGGPAAPHRYRKGHRACAHENGKRPEVIDTCSFY